MADLVNDGGSLRFVLALAAREGGAPAALGPAAAGRLLAGAGIEYLDHRDGEWWPILRLSALYATAEGVQRLAADLRRLLAGAAPGLTWRADEEGGVGLQAGADELGAVVEIGLDVGRFLADVGGAPHGGGELALFRFRARQDALVRFAGALEAELAELSR